MSEQQVPHRQEQNKHEADIIMRIGIEEVNADEVKEAREQEHTLKLEERNLEIAEKARIHAKLPELHSSNIQGTHLDWINFWSLFESQIDQAHIKDKANSHT